MALCFQSNQKLLISNFAISFHIYLIPNFSQISWCLITYYIDPNKDFYFSFSTSSYFSHYFISFFFFPSYFPSLPPFHLPLFLYLLSFLLPPPCLNCSPPSFIPFQSSPAMLKEKSTHVIIYYTYQFYIES